MGSGRDDDLGSAETALPASTAASSAAPADEPAPRGYRSVEVGAALGRYAIEAELGQGGMATVYRARDAELRRDVAVKVLFPHLAKKREVVRRFQREARAAAGLEHAHILRVYDVGGGDSPGGDPPYIVMELVRGGASLRDVMERAGAGPATKESGEPGASSSIQGSPLGAELVASIGAVVCDALAVAHGKGVVHRDVKPGNVLVAPGGRLLLADFGVARVEDDDASLITRTGALLGTPSFMSPEQAQGVDVDARSDLYSVGASLYQLATASLPFAGPTARVVAQIVRGELTAPLRRTPSMGADLARAIEALMAIDPAKRPATASAAAARLREVAAAGGVDDVEAELARFFADPAAYRAARPASTARVVVARAREAIAARQLARAIALADRAAALAPDDADVQALAEEIARGGRRKRSAIALGAAVAVAAAGAAIVMTTRSRGTAPAGASALDARSAAGALAPSIDAPLRAETIGPPDATAVAIAPASPDAAVIAVHRADAHLARASSPDAREPASIAIDAEPAPASVPTAIDAAPAPIAIDAAPAPAPAHVTLVMDAWCDVAIDGVPHGRASRAPIELPPGPHRITCSQGTGGASWSGTVELAPGQDRTVTGALFAKVAVTLELDAVIDGVAHQKGEVVPLEPGRHSVSGRGWFSVTRDAPCRLRAEPELGCY